MALWKDSTAKDTDVLGRDMPAATPREIQAPARDAFPKQPEKPVAAAPTEIRGTRERPEVRELKDSNKESLIAAGLTIEGKIQGAGHVRIAGQFNGDVHVEGNLTIEPGARLTGQVRANTVVVGGELEGNIDAAARVELLESGMLSGDLKAGSLTVAAGSRMRGRVEFGWDGKPLKKENGSGS
jgi:cytoskeletal protein CcmA (bactofilin family)